VAAVYFISFFFLDISRTFRVLTYSLLVYIFKMLLENLKSFVPKEKEENILFIQAKTAINRELYSQKRKGDNT